MPSTRNSAIRLGVTFVVATALSWPSVTAVHAGPSCNILDVLNSGATAVGSLGSPQCAAAAADDGGAVASYAIAGALEGVSAANSNDVNSFCNAVGQIGDDLNKLQAGLDGLNAGVDLASTLGSLDPLSILECACDVQQGVNQFIDELGQCACALADLLPGVHCDCSPPPPVQANCALPSNCFTGSSDPACQAGLQGGNVIFGCNSFDANSGIGPHCTGNEQDGPTGAFVSTHLGSDPNCGQLLYCFCPKPMVPVWTQPPSTGIFDPFATSVFTCQCPSGTYQPKSKSGQPLTQAGVPVCLCDYTNQPPKATDDPSKQCDINLVKNSCPANEILVGTKCVQECPPNEGMTLQGACCDPALISSCGQCCPSNTVPDPATGGCTPPRQPIAQ